MTKHPHHLILLVTLAAASGCSDFSTPAELDRPQILVMVAEPPAVPLRESAQLSIVVADGTGELTNTDVQWDVAAQVAGLPPLGSIEQGSDAVTYHAPEALPSLPELAMVQATVTVGDEQLVGLKGVVIGPLPLANPIINGVSADGADVMTAGVVEVRPGQAAELAVSVDAAPDAELSFAWYSTLGEIEQYRSSPTELVAPEQTGDGWLFVVVRNDTGGATWHKLQLSVR